MTHRCYVILLRDGTRHYYAVPTDDSFDDGDRGVLRYGGAAYNLVQWVHVHDDATTVEVKGFDETYRWLPWDRISRVDAFGIDELVHEVS